MYGQELVYQIGELGWRWPDFIPSRSKFLDQKTFVFDFFSKSSVETFCCLEDKFIQHLNLWRRVKTACSQICNWANGMWNRIMKNNKSEIDTFKFHLFMVSSNDWRVQLIAIELKQSSSVLHLPYSKNFWSFCLKSAVSCVLES